MSLIQINTSPEVSKQVKNACDRYFGYCPEENDEADCEQDELDWLIWCILYGNDADLRKIQYTGIHRYLRQLKKPEERDFARRIIEWVAFYKDTFAGQHLEGDEEILAKHVMERFPGRKGLGIFGPPSDSQNQVENVNAMLSDIFKGKVK